MRLPKIYVVHDKHIFEEKGEKTLPESILRKGFVLERPIAINPLRLMGRIMRQMELRE